MNESPRKFSLALPAVTAAIGILGLFIAQIHWRYLGVGAVLSAAGFGIVSLSGRQWFVRLIRAGGIFAIIEGWKAAAAWYLPAEALSTLKTTYHIQNLFLLLGVCSLIVLTQRLWMRGQPGA
jgi:hypothetical protein